MTSVRERETVVRESRVDKRKSHRMLLAHRHPRGAFMPLPVGACSALLLSLLLAVGVALRF